jgi:hypothetical protein
LTDFDSHCHERLSLSSDSWKAELPVHLLNQVEQDEFQASRNFSSATADKYKGSPALYAFSQVFFNAHHTVATVYDTLVWWTLWRRLLDCICATKQYLEAAAMGFN